MIERKPILTDRLVLRPYEPADGDAVWPVVSHPLIYATTYNIPKDYPRENVDRWFEMLRSQWHAGDAYEFGMFCGDDGGYVGNCGLIKLDKRHRRAAIAYMIDPALWGRGYATEAAKGVCAFGFDVLSLHRIDGSCMSKNPASRAVMEKTGFRFEGTQRQWLEKDGAWMDVDMLGLLRQDFANP